MARASLDTDLGDVRTFLCGGRATRVWRGLPDLGARTTTAAGPALDSRVRMRCAARLVQKPIHFPGHHHARESR